MARLPIPGSDSGSWGDILNDYLSQTHNPDGTLRSDVVSSANISDGSIDATKLAESYVQSSEKGSPNGVATLDGTGKVPIGQLPPGTDPVMGGDLTGTASNAQIAGGAIVDADINASAAIAQSKIANLTADLAGKAAASHAHVIADITNLQTSLDAKADEAITVSGGTSLTGGGDLTANRTLTLINDSATPGNSRYYGTDGAGAKGFHTLPTQDPALGGDLTGTASNAQIGAGAIVDADINASAAIAQSKVANLNSDLASKQTADADLTAIAALSPANDDLLQRKAGAWTNRTPAQVKTDLALTKADVGLANVDNTSDVNKPVSTAAQTALDAKADETITVSGGTSLTGGGDLTANRTLALVNDSATPGNSRYYGTDGAGAKGFHTLPAGDPAMGGDLSGTASNAQIVAGTVGIAELAAAVAQSLVPTGSVTPFAGSGTPSGWLVCDGTAVSRATYATLFTAIGIAYGAGDGSTTFNLPNLKGKVPVGLDAAQTEFDALGESGGSKTHTLTVAEMPSHTHVQDAHNHTQNAHNHIQDAHNHTQNAHSHTAGTLALAHTVRSEQQFITDAYNDYLPAGGFNAISGWNNDASNAVTGSTANATATNIATTATNQAATATNQAATATNQNTGGGGAHNNLQPYITLNYIIKH